MDNLAIIDHTYVDPSLRGQGIAEQLVRLVVDKMRGEGRKIIPQCSCAARQFDRVAEYHDMRAENS